MSEIKLFVSCHQPTTVPKHPLLVPIQVGTVLAGERFPNFLHDDEGDNISEKNRSYCELTAQYWVWKNADVDYVGFFHYRRYLYPDTGEKRPYRVEGAPRLELLEQLGYGEFPKLIEQYDVIAPIAENMYVSVREHYASAPHHHGADLRLTEQILCEKYPEYANAAEKYLSGTECYFGNIFVMKRRYFADYCEWLFPILEEFDREADLSDYSSQELRVDGYLAERLFGIWMTHRRNDLRVCELPRVHFEPNTAERWKKRVLNVLLPPGSQRRARVKGMAKKR